MPSPSVAVMWFRRDLRLADNPALAASRAPRTTRCCRCSSTTTAFVHRRAHRGSSSCSGCLAGARRIARWSTRLSDRRSGGRGPRHRREQPGRPRCTAPRTSARTARAATTRWSRRSPPTTESCVGSDRRMRFLLERSSPGRATPFKVFTPFSRAWRAHGWDAPVRRAVRPKWTTGVRSDGPPPVPRGGTPNCPSRGSRRRRRGRTRFWPDRSSSTPDRRNDPGADRTSRLSPYLKFGCIHPRQLLNRLGRASGPRTFATELLLARLLRRRAVPPPRDRPPAVRGEDGGDARGSGHAGPTNASMRGARA